MRDVVVEIVGASLSDELVVCHELKRGEILVRSRIDSWIEVVMTQELILVVKSRDEVGAVEHVRSMAENGAKVKRWWTVVRVVLRSSQLPTR